MSEMIKWEDGIHLTPKEAGILQYLKDNADRTLSPEEIYGMVWEAEPFLCRDIIAVHIHNLRAKTERTEKRHIFHVFGKGYEYRS